MIPEGFDVPLENDAIEVLESLCAMLLEGLEVPLENY